VTDRLRPAVTDVRAAAATTFAGLGRALRRRTTHALVVSLGLVALVRVLPFPSVYRGRDVVLSSNDPYFYRYLVDRMTATAAGPLDVGALASLPPAAARGEPLLVATLWWVAEVLGAGPWTTGTVLAWYPVVSAVVTGGLVYLLAVRLSDDRRVGLAAVVFFAVVPGHAFRTGLGFADHHAFDYPWLVLTAFALVGLAGDGVEWPWSRRTVLTAALLGVGVAGQVLAWEAGPLLLAPLALGVAVYAPFAAQAGDIPAFGAIVAGLAGGAALVAVAHVALGWQAFTVAITPALLVAGGVGLLLGVAAADRLGRPAVAVVVAEFAVAALLVAAVQITAPTVVAEFTRGLEFLRAPSTAGEMQSITATWGPVFGPLIMLGFTPFLAVPAMLWSAWDAVRRRVPGWLILSLYGWTFLGLSLVQRRFTGELAPFVAVFAGLGFVGLGSTLDLTRAPAFLRRISADGGPSATEDAPPSTSSPDATPSPTVEMPGRRRALVLGSLGAVFTVFPALYSAFIHSRVTIDPRKHAAARWMQRYADERGWGSAERYVFSDWGHNRMYNYFVSGESRSYSFAQRHYEEFVGSRSPEAWYERLRSRVGFVVTTDGPVFDGMWSAPMYERLHEGLGSRLRGTPGLAHYRAVYASDDGYVKVFTLVPGATLVGRGPTDATVRVETTVDVHGRSFSYERRVETDERGEFALTVPHAGSYRIGDVEVSIPETAVAEGRTVEVGSVE
jgi:dolichyl-diphosphooligosaccharide--protein glycosyltransferase